jgi:metal-responsive CopG/Arc/MetJ family transcriptional regulator
MFVKSSKEKNKILGIRLNEASLKEFEKFCQSRHVSKSEIARTAITQYIILNYNEQKNPKMIFSKSQFKSIINCLEADEIENLVQISMKNGKEDMKSLENIIPKPKFETPQKTEIDFQLKTLKRFIFSKIGQAWFEEFTYFWDRKVLIVEGRHKLGHNFSDYIAKLLKDYVSMHQYELKQEEYRLIRNESREENHLHLEFHPILNIENSMKKKNFK